MKKESWIHNSSKTKYKRKCSNDSMYFHLGKKQIVKSYWMKKIILEKNQDFKESLIDNFLIIVLSRW